METTVPTHTPLNPEEPGICSASCPACRELRLAGKPDRTPKVRRVRGTRGDDPDDFADNYFTRDQ